ncbi:MAG: phosphatidate cytidylyltransferase [Deltaproteobacteria bacterium]
MSAATDILILLFAAIVVLTLATALSQYLKLRFSPDGMNTVIETFNTRVMAWWGMVAALALAFLAGRTGVVLLFAFCSFAALREFLTLTTKLRADHWALVAAFYVVLPVQYWLVWSNWYGFYAVFIPVYVFLLLPMLAAMRGDTSRFLFRIAETQWALMVSIYCVSHVPALMMLQLPDFAGKNVLLMLFLVIVSQIAELLNVLISRYAGKHKISPNLPATRTWEGLIGTAIAAFILGAALFWITPFSPLQAGVMGTLIALMGYGGGLVMAAIKRDRDIKDWGHLIAGHGGFLDRLETIAFAAPIFFHLTRYYFDTSPI